MTSSHGEPKPARAEPAPSLLRQGRELSGMSQEALADYLRIDPRTVRRYESGEIPVPDGVMLEVAELPHVPPILLYKHFKRKYDIGDDILPPVEAVPLSVAVIHLLRELRRLETAQAASKLLDLADDGIIDPEEQTDFDMIMDKLDGVRRAVELLRYHRRD